MENKEVISQERKTRKNHTNDLIKRHGAVAVHGLLKLVVVVVKPGRAAAARQAGRRAKAVVVVKVKVSRAAAVDRVQRLGRVVVVRVVAVGVVVDVVDVVVERGVGKVVLGEWETRGGAVLEKIIKSQPPPLASHTHTHTLTASAAATPLAGPNMAPPATPRGSVSRSASAWPAS